MAKPTIKVTAKNEIDTIFNEWYVRRSEKFIKDTGVSKAAFARICGISASTVYKMLNESKRLNWKPRVDTMLKVKIILTAREEMKRLDERRAKRKETS